MLPTDYWHMYWLEGAEEEKEEDEEDKEEDDGYVKKSLDCQAGF